MLIVHRGRREGKTTDLVDWVKGGVSTDSYPFWSRILLVHSLQEAQRMRVRGNEYDLDYNQVYSLLEWSNARRGILPVEIGIDNADHILQSLIGGTNLIRIASFNQEG